MTTQADIKLVIDQLHNMYLIHDADEIVIVNAVEMLETLGNQVVAQAAVIDNLRDALHITANNCQYLGAEKWDIVAKALSTPTDSTQVLQEWLDSVLGEPVGYQELFDAIAAGTKPYAGSGISISVKAFTGCIGPLFKKPEILK